MSFVYTPAKKAIFDGDIDFALDDIRAMLVKLKANTSTDTERDTPHLADFTTLGELVATNYVRKALNTQAVVEDDPADLARFTADPITWTALGGGVNDVIGAIVLYKFVTNDADSIPIAYIDNGGLDFNFPTNGSDAVLNWNVAGILQET